MATNPNIKVGVDTSDAVKSLENLEGAAVEAEGKVEAVDGDTVSLNASDAIRALEDVGKRLDDVDAKGQKAGGKSGGIGTTTTAFKDLTEGIGGPGIGGTAVASIFGFGESLEGVGDILEGFGGKMGLSEEQVGKLTTGLGNGLAALGVLGVGITLATAAYQGLKSITDGAAKKQEEFNKSVQAAQTELKSVTELLAEGKKAEAYRKIVENLTDEFDLFSAAGVNVADVVRAIAEQDRGFITQLKNTESALYDQGAALEYETEAAYGRHEISDQEYDDRIAQVEALDQQAAKTKEVADLLNIQITASEKNADTNKIVEEALGNLNTTTERSIELEKERLEAIKNTAQEELRAIDSKRAYERSLDDVQQALVDYEKEVQAAKGDTEKIDDATRDAADSVIELAQEYGGLEGAAVGTEEWQRRTTTALGYVAATLAPDSPLRKQLLDYIKEIESIPTVKETNIKSFYSSPDSQMAAPRYPREGGINVTVNGALDPNAVARQIQRILSDQTIRYSL